MSHFEKFLIKSMHIKRLKELDEYQQFLKAKNIKMFTKELNTVTSYLSLKEGYLTSPVYRWGEGEGLN